MNLQNVFTKMDKFLQEHLKIWDYKILPHFLDNLDETAAQSGALQRKRSSHSVYDLLKLFFFMHVPAFPSVSWGSLCAWNILCF